MIKQGEERILGVKIFDTHGNLLGYSTLDEIDLSAGEFLRAPLRVGWKDHHDTFYLLDVRSTPVVRVFRLTGI